MTYRSGHTCCLGNRMCTCTARGGAVKFAGKEEVARLEMDRWVDRLSDGMVMLCVCVFPRTRCTAPGTSCSFVQKAGCLLTARNVEYLADDKGDLLC